MGITVLSEEEGAETRVLGQAGCISENQWHCIETEKAYFYSRYFTDIMWR